VDDPIFNGITPAQMAWYSLMIAQEKEKEVEKTISYLDYHASFTNYEGVKKAKEARESQKEDVVKEAEEFIEEAKNNNFKNNPLIEAIKKIRESNKIEETPESPLKSINLNKLIREEI
jgi:hypothetical protein